MRGRLPDFSTRPRGNGPGPFDLALLLAALGLLVLSGRAAWKATAELRQAERDSETLRLSSGLASSHRPAGRDLGSVDRFVAPLLLSADSPPSQVVADLVPLLPNDVRLEQLSLEYGESLGVELRVVARSAAAYDELLERLATSEWFVGLVPGSEDRDGEVRSTIKLRHRDAGAGGGA